MNNTAVNWVLYQIESLGQDPRQALPRMIKQAKKEAPDNVRVVTTLKDAYKQALATKTKDKQARKKLNM